MTKFNKIFFILTVGLILGSLFFQVSDSSLVYQLKAQEKELQVVRQANQGLQIQLSALSGVERISSLAQKQGMTKAEKITFLKTNLRLAYR